MRRRTYASTLAVMIFSTCNRPPGNTPMINGHRLPQDSHHHARSHQTRGLAPRLLKGLAFTTAIKNLQSFYYLRNEVEIPGGFETTRAQCVLLIANMPREERLGLQKVATAETADTAGPFNLPLTTRERHQEQEVMMRVSILKL